MKYFSIFSATICTVLLALAASAQGNFQPLWETKLNHYDKEHALLTTIVSTGAEEKVAVLSPMAIEVFDCSRGDLIGESACEKRAKGYMKLIPSPSKSSGIKIGASKKNELPTVAEALDALQKVVHVPLPHRNAVLRFDYGAKREVFSLIDLDNGAVLWTNSDLKWGMERARYLFEYTLHDIGGIDQLNYPSEYIANLIKIIPERDEILIDSFSGLACVDLSTGNMKWLVEEAAKGLSHTLYDKKSKSLLAIGGNPSWLSMVPDDEDEFKNNKFILRIEVSTGDIIWQSSFNEKFHAKKDGSFENEPSKADVRIKNGMILTNFNQVEIFDFETGKPLFKTTTGKDLRVGFEGSPLEFAYPVIKDGVLYRSVMTSLMAFGITKKDEHPDNNKITIEAYNISTGELLWSSEEIARQKINNMAVKNDLLLLSFDGNEGVKALNSATGEQVWSFETSKKGATTKWELTEDEVIVVEKSDIHFLDIATGELRKTIDAKKATGDIAEIDVRNGKLLALGEKGIAFYDIQDARVISEIKTGYKSEIHEYENKVVIFPIDPTNPLMILDSNNMSVIGTVKKSGKRTALLWCETTGNAYQVQGKKVSAQHLDLN